MEVHGRVSIPNRSGARWQAMAVHAVHRVARAVPRVVLIGVFLLAVANTLDFQLARRFNICWWPKCLCFLRLFNLTSHHQWYKWGLSCHICHMVKLKSLRVFDHWICHARCREGQKLRNFVRSGFVPLRRPKWQGRMRRQRRQLSINVNVYRRKFRSQTSDNMDRWEAEMGRGREKRKIRREKIRRERVRRKKMQMREKVGKSRFTVFFHWLGSLKRRVRSQLARWEMKNCTPLCREAHFQVKMYKPHHCRTTFGSCDVEKVHAVVARSTFPSQNVQNTPGSDYFWKLRCWKIPRSCGAKHILKSKCTKHISSGPLLAVEMSKKCTLLWRQVHFQVKMYRTHQDRTTFGSWDVEKVHTVVAPSTFPSQNVQNTPGSDHFWKLRCRKSAHCCGAKYISKSKCTEHTRIGPLLEVEMSKKCTPLWREAHFQV